MTPAEIKRVQKYLQEKFGNIAINLSDLSNAGDSVEVKLGSEFIGVIYKDEEDGEISYNFNMAILDIDLPPAA